MTWDDGRWRADDRAAALSDGSPVQLVLPVIMGLLGGLVVHLALFTVILAVAVTVTDTSNDFTTGDALVWGTVGALGLAVGAAACGWVIRRTAALRGLGDQRAQRVALFAALAFAAVMILFGLAPALRLATLPVYVVIAALGAYLGSGRRLLG